MRYRLAMTYHTYPLKNCKTKDLGIKVPETRAVCHATIIRGGGSSSELGGRDSNVRVHATCKLPGTQ